MAWSQEVVGLDFCQFWLGVKRERGMGNIRIFLGGRRILTPVSLQGEPGESGSPGVQGEPGVKVSDGFEAPLPNPFHPPTPPPLLP